MSCFAGLFSLDGAPVDPGLLGRMADRLGHRSPDGVGRWIGGRIGLAHGRLWTTPEEVGEAQPIADAAGRLWLAADCRIDNRGDLLPRLGLAADASDARLLLAAWRAWGDEACDRLLGDFAFALWDGSRLHLARDAMGLRQVYYLRHGGTVLFGSTIGAVLAALPERPPLNRALIEAFLRDSYRHWVRGTVWQGLYRVPPGHLLTIDGSGDRLRGWWRLGSTFGGGCDGDEEWCEAFREAFDEAVRCRLRGTGPVTVLTGGGLDSASIASTAHAVGGPAGGGGLHLASLTFETETADEGDYFDELAGHLRGTEAHRIPAEDLPLSLVPWDGDDQPLDEPELYLLRSHTAALFDCAARRGGRVVLAGEGANQVLRHSFYYDPAALRLVGWRNLAAELPWFRAACQVGPLELLPRAFLWPLVPAGLRERLRRMRRDAGRPWVRPAGPGSWRRRLPPPPGRTLAASLPAAGRWAASSIGRPFDLARYGAIDVTAAHAGVEWRLPFLDRRVVDLLLHAPRRLFSWRGEDRRVLRRAMAGRMPERLRLRRGKSHIQDVLDRRLRRAERETIAHMLDKPRAEAVDCVTSSIAAAFETFWNGTGTAYGELSFLALESWLRRLPGKGC